MVEAPADNGARPRAVTGLRFVVSEEVQTYTVGTGFIPCLRSSISRTRPIALNANTGAWNWGTDTGPAELVEELVVG